MPILTYLFESFEHAQPELVFNLGGATLLYCVFMTSKLIRDRFFSTVEKE